MDGLSNYLNSMHDKKPVLAIILNEHKTVCVGRVGVVQRYLPVSLSPSLCSEQALDHAPLPHHTKQSTGIVLCCNQLSEGREVTKWSYPIGFHINPFVIQFSTNPISSIAHFQPHMHLNFISVTIKVRPLLPFAPGRFFCCCCCSKDFYHIFRAVLNAFHTFFYFQQDSPSALIHLCIPPAACSRLIKPCSVSLSSLRLAIAFCTMYFLLCMYSIHDSCLVRWHFPESECLQVDRSTVYPYCYSVLDVSSGLLSV